MLAETLQQTPSTQLPLVQSDPVEHAWPFGSLSPHFFVWVLHETPGTQSPSFSHVSAHLLPLHLRYGVHDCVWAAGQLLMLGSQVAARVMVAGALPVAPGVHVCARQPVSLP